MNEVKLRSSSSAHFLVRTIIFKHDMSNSLYPKAGAIIIALMLSSLFLWITIYSNDSVFNFLPFAIHETINPGGSSESAFIMWFDIMVAIILIIPSYKLAHKLLRDIKVR